MTPKEGLQKFILSMKEWEIWNRMEYRSPEYKEKSAYRGNKRQESREKLQEIFTESYHSDTGGYLTDAQIDKIRVDMALRTLDEYIEQAGKDGNLLTSDLNYEQIKDIHKDK